MQSLLKDLTTFKHLVCRSLICLGIWPAFDSTYPRVSWQLICISILDNIFVFVVVIYGPLRLLLSSGQFSNMKPRGFVAHGHPVVVEGRRITFGYIMSTFIYRISVRRAGDVISRRCDRTKNKINERELSALYTVAAKVSELFWKKTGQQLVLTSRGRHHNTVFCFKSCTKVTRCHQGPLWRYRFFFTSPHIGCVQWVSKLTLIWRIGILYI